MNPMIAKSISNVAGPFEVSAGALIGNCRVTYTLVKSTSRSNEEASTDGTANCDHVQMAGLQGMIEQIVTI